MLYSALYVYSLLILRIFEGSLFILNRFQASTSMIPAHSGQLAAIQFSPSGTRIATASDKGTVIRVFSVTGKTYIQEII